MCGIFILLPLLMRKYSLNWIWALRSLKLLSVSQLRLPVELFESILIVTKRGNQNKIGSLATAWICLWPTENVKSSLINGICNERDPWHCAPHLEYGTPQWPCFTKTQYKRKRVNGLKISMVKLSILPSFSCFSFVDRIIIAHLWKSDEPEVFLW